MPTPQTASDILQKARKLISKPEAWTKGSFARDAEGRICNSDRSPFACSWCALGAINYSTNSFTMAFDAFRLARSLLCKAVRARVTHDDSDNPTTNPASYNDSPSTTHADILAVFDDAIAQAISLENAR